MKLLLLIGLNSLGISAILIGLMFFVLGPQSTADFFAPIAGFLEGGSRSIVGFNMADIDSEFRFYSVFWIAYGACLIYVASNLRTQIDKVPLLLLLFFMGGVARLFSFLSVGLPHPLFQILWAIEIGLPILLIGLWLGVKGQFNQRR